MKKIYWKRSIYLAIAGILVGLDAWVKHWAVNVLKPIGTLELWKGVIGLRYAENTGAAFSAFLGAVGLLSIISLLVCITVAGILMIYPKLSRMMGICLTLILSGGIGNLIDRVCLGYVVDMFEFQFIHFAVFNVADICITVGAVLLFVVILLGGEKDERMDD